MIDDSDKAIEEAVEPEEQFEEEDSEQDELSQIREEFSGGMEEEEEVSEDDSSEEFVADSEFYDNFFNVEFSKNYKYRSIPAFKNFRGKIGILVKDKSLSYTLDFSDNEIKVLNEEINADCTISIDNMTFKQIKKRKLNPQIAMLANRIQLSGNYNLGMYFFNFL